jgi:hypothetical protein
MLKSSDNINLLFLLCFKKKRINYKRNKSITTEDNSIHLPHILKPAFHEMEFILHNSD